jgi:hypothetical protein
MGLSERMIRLVLAGVSVGAGDDEDVSATGVEGISSKWVSSCKFINKIS